MIRTRIAVFVGALFAFATLAGAFSAGLADTVPIPRPDVVVLERTSDAADAWDQLLATVIGAVTAALVFVGSAFMALRPYLIAKAAEAIQSVQFDKRGVFERAVEAGLELYPNRFDDVVSYVNGTIPDTLADLGIKQTMLPSIIEARKLALDREREDRRKRAA